MTADKGVRFLGPRCGSGARKAAWGVRDEPGKAQALELGYIHPGLLQPPGPL